MMSCLSDCAFRDASGMVISVRRSFIKTVSGSSGFLLQLN